MKKTISLIIAIMLIIASIGVCAAEEQNGDYYFILAQVDNNQIFVNGIAEDFDALIPEVTPVKNENGEVLVPLRRVVGMIGGWIDWEAETDTVLINYNGKTISFKMGSKQIQVDDEIVEISVAPYTIYDRTVVPLDFFERCLKGSAELDEDTDTAMFGFYTTVYAAG